MKKIKFKIIDLLKKSLTPVLVVLLSGASIALASVTISNTGISGDASFSGVTSTAAMLFDVGTGNTLSLQTTNNGAITSGSGLFTIGGALNVGGLLSATNTNLGGNLLFAAGQRIDSSAAGTLLIGNSTTTGITIGRAGQTVTFPGNASTSGTFVIGGGGTPIVTHLSASSTVNFGAIASTTCVYQPLTATGTVAGDSVYAAPIPTASGIETSTNTLWVAYASTTNIVAIKACNIGTGSSFTPSATQIWRVDVWRH